MGPQQVLDVHNPAPLLEKWIAEVSTAIYDYIHKWLFS